MRLEGDEDQFGLSLCGNVSRGFENPLMAEMDAVEISDGHDGSLGGIEQAVEAVENLHRAGSISAGNGEEESWNILGRNPRMAVVVQFEW